jgi:hypothetical protein
LALLSNPSHDEAAIDQLVAISHLLISPKAGALEKFTAALVAFFALVPNLDVLLRRLPNSTFLGCKNIRAKAHPVGDAIL